MRLFGIKYNIKESIKTFQVFQVFSFITLPPAAEHDATTFSKQLEIVAPTTGSSKLLIFRNFSF